LSDSNLNSLFASPKIYSLIILVLSVIGFILVTFTPFAGFYLTGFFSGYRYSCLTCEYATAVDRTAIILAMLLLLGQIVISLNELWPETILSQFLPANFSRWGIFFAVFTLIITLIGGAAFASAYSNFEWWFEAGFYGGAIAGLLNSILFVLKGRMQ
jgi:hypothetical protein